MQIGVRVQYNSVQIISLDEMFDRLEGLLLRKMQKLEVKIHRKITIYTDVAGKIRRHVWFFSQGFRSARKNLRRRMEDFMKSIKIYDYETAKCQKI